MDRTEVKEKFYNILKKQLCLEDNYFSRFSNDGENKLLINELKADALDWYEILSEIEYQFKINMQDAEFYKCKYIHEFINLIYNICNEKN